MIVRDEQGKLHNHLQKIDNGLGIQLFLVDTRIKDDDAIQTNGQHSVKTKEFVK